MTTLTSGVPRGPKPARGLRHRSQGATAGLAAVLLTLAVFISWGNLTTTRAAGTQAQALALAGLFEQVQYGVAVQELYARQYQLAPSSAIHRRYLNATQQTVRTLNAAQGLAADPRTRAQVRALQDLEAGYREVADRMVQAVTTSDADSVLVDAAQVAPAYFSLQERADEVAHAYRVAAQERVAQLRRLQQRMLVGTVVGFGLGLFLLGMIWRLVLGFQHKLARHADLNAHLALHDALTGLPNRTCFTRQLTEQLAAAAGASTRARSSAQVFDPVLGAVLGPGDAAPAGSTPGPAIMILDLDRFKEVNDTLGHHAGDQLLVEVGRRLIEALRPKDLVARLGGDEFAVVLPGLPDVETARQTAQRACAVLCEPFRLDAAAAPVSIAASVGVAFWSVRSTLDDLVQQADSAMYRAKAGHLGVAVYDELLDVEDPARLALFGQLRSLLDSGDPAGELVLHYQPQVRLADAEIHGVEALARWLHPDRGLLSPGVFLPIAEQTGLELALTYHLLAVATAQAAGWARSGRPLPVAVNVSPPCLLDPGFAASVVDNLTRHGLPSSLLRIEVTEGSVMADPERSRQVLETLRDAGIGVSVDDFGSGYSSLGQLRRMPMMELKIDQSFVRDLAQDADDVVLVRTAIDLGHHHGTVVVAEGVEDVGALAILRDLGCDVAQGFLLARPVPPDQLFEVCERASTIMRQALASRPDGVPRQRAQPSAAIGTAHRSGG